MDNDNYNQKSRNTYFYKESTNLIFNLPEHEELYKKAFFTHIEGSCEYCEKTTTDDYQ